MIKEIKRMFCKHKNRHFVKYLHGDEINWHDGKRFEYECNDCGAPVWLKHPDDCVQCKHFYYTNDGDGGCDRNLAGKACIATYRGCWEERDHS